MSAKVITLDELTWFQAKLIAGTTFTRNGETTIQQRGIDGVILDIEPDPKYKLPVRNKPILFSYLEEPSDTDDTKYWCCAISTQVNMFTKRRRVTVLKVGRYDAKGNAIEIKDENPFQKLERQFCN